MRKLSAGAMVLCFVLVYCNNLFAQAADADTTIYPVAEEPPRFPVCEKLDTTIEFKNQCAQQQ
ncbi:MAG: hypothetical protein SFU99_07340, partial [Saprospiraceae bacterium]|nr:hypothetical protein [Saprospiraceae bacterium]